jgi:hypothetical protein
MIITRNWYHYNDRNGICTEIKDKENLKFGLGTLIYEIREAIIAQKRRGKRHETDRIFSKNQNSPCRLLGAAFGLLRRGGGLVRHWASGGL